jgi:Ca-activated chloride channel family protein
MLDTSLSMQFEKLDRAYEAAEALLRSLTPQDTFNLMLFNDDVGVFSNEPVDARSDQIERALSFIKSSYLSGGTDTGAALDRAAILSKAMPSSKERSIVMITDELDACDNPDQSDCRPFSKSQRLGSEG